MSDRKLNNDPAFLATAIMLNTDRFNMYIGRAREYYNGAGDKEDVQWALEYAKDASDRIRELRRRQRSQERPTPPLATQGERHEQR